MLILLRVGEKLAIKLKIVRYKNKGLRDAIIHKKKKRKREKAMQLYDPGEHKEQTLFFNLTKIARVRQRVADAK
jgi:hypothetical protein